MNTSLRSVVISPPKAKKLRSPGASDPMVKAVKKAYRSSFQFQLDQLLAKRSYWQRKETLAANKLADVEKEIREFAQQMVEAVGAIAKTDETIKAAEEKGQ